VDSPKLVLALLEEAYEKKTWHGPNLKQSIKGISAKQAAWRPGPGRHNIWEEMPMRRTGSTPCGEESKAGSAVLSR